MYGLLIYDDAGALRNGWFIGEMLKYAASVKEELRFTRSSELRFGCENGTAFFDFPDGRRPDYAIVRTVFPLLSQRLEDAGVRVFNNKEVSRIANDKRLTHALFSQRGVPMARTWFLSRSAFDPCLYEYPLILKSASGHGGSEVFYVENVKSAARAVEKIKDDGFLMQEIVDKGRDVRVYLLGDQILAAVERRSEEDFRANFSLGGGCALCEPDDAMREVVKTVYSTLDPTFIGVDFTFRNGQPILNEIEDAVGSRMLYKLTDIPVHARLFDEVLRSMRRTNTE